MITVATFMAGHDAHLARGVLESEGIPASVIDENTSATVLYSPAIGGVKVQVNDEDYDRARKILEIGPSPAESPTKEEPSLDVCPKCGSSSVSTNPFSLKTVAAFLVSFFVQIPVLSRRTQRVCKKWGTKW
jgi:hypothetical protein